MGPWRWPATKRPLDQDVNINWSPANKAVRLRSHLIWFVYLNAVRDPGFKFGEMRISPNLSLKAFVNDFLVSKIVLGGFL